MRLGLTGGAGSGKSRVAAVFGRLGAAVIDADQLAREAVAPGTPGLAAVVAAFGEECLKPDGTLDRHKLGRLVFEDVAARHRLESIVHPEVRRLMRERADQAERAGVRVIVMEVPLLFEARLEREVDKVVVVDAHPAAQVQRLMARDGFTEEEARLRLAAQLSREEKARRADYLIDNSGAWEETERQVEQLWEEINQ